MIPHPETRRKLRRVPHPVACHRCSVPAELPDARNGKGEWLCQTCTERLEAVRRAIQSIAGLFPSNLPKERALAIAWSEPVLNALARRVSSWEALFQAMRILRAVLEGRV